MAGASFGVPAFIILPMVAPLPTFLWRGLRFPPSRRPKPSCVRGHNRRIIPDDMSIPLRRLLALPGWGDADFHGVVNFRFTEFSEVRCR